MSAQWMPRVTNHLPLKNHMQHLQLPYDALCMPYECLMDVRMNACGNAWLDPYMAGVGMPSEWCPDGCPPGYPMNALWVSL